MPLLLCDSASFSCTLGLNAVNGYNPVIYKQGCCMSTSTINNIPVTTVIVTTQHSFNCICEKILRCLVCPG
jgi:hypothetical protein